MNTTAPIRPVLQRTRRVSIPAGPTAPAEARCHVRAAVYAWDVPVDPAIAVLLTSELVTNAVIHETGESILLVITSDCGCLRVDVHDTSRALPVPVNVPVEAETGRGLMLIHGLSSGWGYYPTHAGKAVYFTLAFPADP